MRMLYESCFIVVYFFNFIIVLIGIVIVFNF